MFKHQRIDAYMLTGARPPCLSLLGLLAENFSFSAFWLRSHLGSVFWLRSLLGSAFWLRSSVVIWRPAWKSLEQIMLPHLDASQSSLASRKVAATDYRVFTSLYTYYGNQKNDDHWFSLTFARADQRPTSKYTGIRFVQGEFLKCAHSDILMNCWVSLNTRGLMRACLMFHK